MAESKTGVYNASALRRARIICLNGEIMGIKEISAQFKKAAYPLCGLALGGIFAADLAATSMVPQKEEIVVNSTQYTTDLVNAASQDPTTAALVAVAFVAPTAVGVANRAVKKYRARTPER